MGKGARAFSIAQLTPLAQLVSRQVTLDILWSIGSVALCSMVLWVQLGSLALSAAGNVMILLSFPVTFALFGTVLRFEVMTQLNLLAVFICVAVGADDVFVFTDSYKQVAVEFPELAHPDHGALRLCVAWRRAVSAMMVTSLTTSAAFFATTTSPMVRARARERFFSSDGANERCSPPSSRWAYSAACPCSSTLPS